MSNDLGKRMKRYEASYDFKVPPRTYTIVRIDGKNFSKYTKGMDKPFDKTFSDVMDETTKYLCEKLHPKFGYTQSDEISLVFTDFENINEQMMFDGKVQKIASICASLATAKFNQAMIVNKLAKHFSEISNIDDDASAVVEAFNPAAFDARVFIIPDYREVNNYFVWRQQDATRNSVSMAGHAELGPSAIFKKNGSEIQELLFQEKGINWNDYPEKFKRGVVVAKEAYNKEVTLPSGETIIAERKRWAIQDTPIFTQEKEFLYNITPVLAIEQE